MGLMRGIRKNVKVIYWVVVVTVVVTFVLWGTRTATVGGRAHVGVAFGKKVSTKEFRRQWVAAQQRAIEIGYRTGQEVTPDLIEDMAWRRVVELREADRWGITVPMSEVRESIRRMFSPEGEFDETLYQNYLYRRGLSEDQLAALIRDDIMIGSIERLVSTSVVVSPQEVREEYNYEKEQRKVKFHLVEAASLLPALEVPGDGEVYYNSHKEEFREPKKVAVRYAMVASAALLDKVSVTEEELKEHYEKNRDSYKAADGTSPEFDAVKAQIERVLKSQKADQMARETAEKLLSISDPSKLKEAAEKNGLVFGETAPFPEEGEIGEQFAKEPEFRKAVFATPFGELSPILKTNEGYCVLTPVRALPDRIPSFEEVKKAAAEKQRAQQLRDEALRAGLPPERVDEFIKALSVTPADIDVTYDEVLRYYEGRKSEFRKPKKVKVQYLLLEKKPFENEVKLTEKEIKTEYDTNPQKYKDEKGQVKPLAEVREQIEKTVREKKADELAQKRADEIFIVSRAQRMKEQGLKHGLSLRESRLFGAGEKIDDYVGDSPMFSSYAFRTTLGEVSPVFDADIGYCVLSPVQVMDEAIADFEEVAQEVVDKTKVNKAETLAGQVAREVQRKVSEKMTLEKKDFDSACKDLGLKVEESGYFRRNDNTIEKLGQAMGLTFSAFRDELGKVAYPRRVTNGYLFYVVSEIKQPSDEEFAKDKELYYGNLVAEKGREAFVEWLTALMQEANVRKSYATRAAREAPKTGAPPAGGSQKPAPPRPPVPSR